MATAARAPVLALVVASFGSFLAAAPTHAADGSWTFIPPQTSPDSLPGPRIGGGMAWDADRDRMILAGGGQSVFPGGPASPLVVLTGGTQWSAPAISGSAAPMTLGPWAIDRSRSQLVSLSGLGTIWSLDLQTFASRIDSIRGPQPAWDGSPIAVAMDTVRDQIIAFSDDAVLPGSSYSASLWTVPLHGDVAWTKRTAILGSPPVFLDDQPTRVTYDSRRDQFLYSHPSRSGVLVMNPDPEWLPDPGLVPVPYEGVACYDTTRDLLVAFGGAAPAIGALGTLGWSRTTAPTHCYLSTDYGSQPAASDPVIAFDGAHDRMIVVEGHTLLEPLVGGWSYAPPSPPRVFVSCSVPAGGYPGSTVDLQYQVTNGSTSGAPVDFSVTCDRRWGTLPYAASRNFEPGEVVGGGMRFDIPDTAAVGLVTFRVGGCCNAGLDSLSNATPTLLVVARPAAPRIVSAVALGDSAVALRWRVDAGTAYPTILLRSLDSSAPDTLGQLAPDANGVISFVDRVRTTGAALRYWLGIVTPAGTIWSDPLAFTTSPATAPALAFGWKGSTVIVHGALDVSFTVPGAGAATVGAYDVRGRLVASARVDSPGPGLQSVRLASGVRLPPGVYLLRLTRGSDSARSRAVLLPGP